jgi:hypothetical protein
MPTVMEHDRRMGKHNHPGNLPKLHKHHLGEDRRRGCSPASSSSLRTRRDSDFPEEATNKEDLVEAALRDSSWPTPNRWLLV